MRKRQLFDNYKDSDTRFCSITMIMLKALAFEDTDNSDSEHRFNKRKVIWWKKTRLLTFAKDTTTGSEKCTLGI